MMLHLRHTIVVNILTDPIITDLLFPLQELLTQGKRLHLDITTNGGLLILLILQMNVITTLTLMMPTFLASGTNMMRQKPGILKIGSEVDRLMTRVTELKTEVG